MFVILILYIRFKNIFIIELIWCIKNFYKLYIEVYVVGIFVYVCYDVIMLLFGCLLY